MREPLKSQNAQFFSRKKTMDGMERCQFLFYYFDTHIVRKFVVSFHSYILVYDTPKTSLWRAILQVGVNL